MARIGVHFYSYFIGKYFNVSAFVTAVNFKQEWLKREALTTSVETITYNYVSQLIRDNINLASQPATITVIKEVNLTYLYRKIVTCTIVHTRTAHNAQQRYHCRNNTANCAELWLISLHTTRRLDTDAKESQSENDVLIVYSLCRYNVLCQMGDTMFVDQDHRVDYRKMSYFF